MKSKAKKTPENVVWVDLLCWASLICIFFKVRGSVSHIRYCHSSIFIRPFRSIIAWLCHIELSEISNVVFAEERWKEGSLYEQIHSTIKDVLDTTGNKWMQHPAFKNFVQARNYDGVKVREHLKEAAFLMVYRPVELYLTASLNQGRKNIFVLKKTPFKDIFNRRFEWAAIYYNAWLPHSAGIRNRRDYLYDQFVRQPYFSGRWTAIFDLMARWLLLSVTILKVHRRYQREALEEIKPGVNIGIDYMQRRYRSDEINELFWATDSGIRKSTLFNLETRDFDDISCEQLSQTGVKRFRVVLTPWGVRKSQSAKLSSPEGICRYIAPPIAFIKFFPELFFHLVACCFYPLPEFWLRFQLLRFQYQVLFWGGIYRELNIRLVMSIVDTDPAKLAKSQAIQLQNGLFAGSHWSNFPMIRGDNQKCCDILFTWGPHFLHNLLNPYPSMWKQCVGYPLDYYFNHHEEAARELRRKYQGKFILSYLDNIMANDLPYSLNMQLDIYLMFSELLEEYPDLVIFLKPKKVHTYEEILCRFSSIEKYVHEGRVVVFLGEEDGIKEVPAKIGMTSDLVVGLGISSAAAECQFAGTPAFHADLTEFRSNGFGNLSLNQVVFRDIEGLKKAIAEIICGKYKLNLEAFRQCHACLDPFQDGQTYKRIGIVMRELQKALNDGKDRDAAVKSVKELCKGKLKFAYDTSELLGDVHHV